MNRIFCIFAHLKQNAKTLYNNKICKSCIPERAKAHPSDDGSAPLRVRAAQKATPSDQIRPRREERGCPTAEFDPAPLYRVHRLLQSRKPPAGLGFLHADRRAGGSHEAHPQVAATLHAGPQPEPPASLQRRLQELRLGERTHGTATGHEMVGAGRDGMRLLHQHLPAKHGNEQRHLAQNREHGPESGRQIRLRAHRVRPDLRFPDARNDRSQPRPHPRQFLQGFPDQKTKLLPFHRVHLPKQQRLRDGNRNDAKREQRGIPHGTGLVRFPG